MANPTTNLNITLPEPGAESSRGTWGTSINDAISDLDVGIADRGVPAGGTDDQILTKNGTDDYATEWATRLSSVGITGTDGIEVDSGSPVTTAGSITLGINKTTLLSYLNAEDGATADQTASEVKTLYENNSDTNAFSDAEQTKLSGIETSATADQTAAEIKSLYESNSNTSVASATTATTATTAIEVAVVDESADTTCFPLFVATATGSVQPKSGTNLTFNSNTGALNSTSFHGDLTGDVTGTATTATTAITATNVTVASESIISSQAVSHQVNANSTVLFSCANHGLADDQPITFTLGTNPPDGVTSGTIYYVRPGLSGSFSGGLTGTANTFTLGTSPGGGIGSISTTSWNGASSHVFNKVRFPLFALAPTGDLPAKSGGGLSLTAEGKLTSTTFAGALTGNVTGTATTATNVAVVDAGAVTSLNVGTTSSQENVNSTVLFGFTGHGFSIDQPIVFTDSSDASYSLPGGIVEGTVYYVQAGEASAYNAPDGLANNFKVSATPGGSAIAWTSGFQGAVPGVAHTVHSALYYPLISSSATGTLPPKSKTALSYNLGTGALNSTSFYGDLTGDVTGTASAIADGIVSEAKLHVSNAPTDGYVLTARSAAAGDMTWEAAGSGSFEPLGNSIAMAIALG